MRTLNDISTHDHICLLVDTFYGKVRVDPLLGGIFNDVIQDRWPEHLAKMYRFWGTVLINEGSYSGVPFRPHAGLPVSEEHFARWLTHFHATVNEFFIGPVADLAHMNAERMAEMFMMRIDRLRKDPRTFIQ